MLNYKISEKKRFIKFAIVGFSGTVVDFGVFNVLTTVLHLPTISASVISFLAAVFNNFFWNRNWTYPESKELAFSGQFLKFGIVSLAGLAIRTPIFSWLEKPLVQFSTATMISIPLKPETIGHNLALGIVIVIVLFWNYFVNKYWTYKQIKVQ